MEIINLVDDDEPPLATRQSPRDESSDAVSGDLMYICTPNHSPDKPTQRCAPLSGRSPLKMPNLFDNDEEDQAIQNRENLQIHDNSVLTRNSSRPSSSSRRVLEEILDESDDDLKELLNSSKRRQRSRATSSPVPNLSSSFSGSVKATTVARPTRGVGPIGNPLLKRKTSEDYTAAQITPEGEDSDIVAIPDDLDEEEPFMNPSLYSGTEQPEGQELKTAEIHELLELNRKSSDATREMNTPVEMDTLLLKHQKQALAWMVEREADDHPVGHPRGGILADDQGFGKTVSAIALFLANRPQPKGGVIPAWGNLIIAPTSVINQWADEVVNHISEQYRPRVLVYHGSGKVKDPYLLVKYDIVITTYGTICQEYPKVLEKYEGIVIKRRPRGALYRVKWFRVVLDEGQAIRNFRRETFKAACELKAERRWSLTGTPIQNTVNDIYSQFLFLGYHVTQNYKEWEAKYKKPLEGLRGGRKRIFERFQAILGVVLLRRAKHDKIDGRPVIELPARNTRTLELTFSKTELAFYQAQEVGAVRRMHDLQDGIASNGFAAALYIILRLRQACGHPALCAWGQENQFTFSDDELDVADIRMKTRCMFNILPEAVRSRLFVELGPNNPSPQACPICFDAIEDGVVTRCGHLFCASDFEEWHRENSSCPTCRGSLGRDDDTMPLEEVRKEVHVLFRRKIREAKAGNRRPKKRGQTMKGGRKQEPKAEPIDLDLGHNAEPIELSLGSKAEPVEIDLTGKRSIETSALESPTKKHCPDEDASDCSEPADDLLDEKDEGRGAKRLRTSTKIKTFIAEYKKIHDESNDKVLCFSQWTRMLDLVEASLKEEGYDYVRLDGSMSPKQRREKLKRFNTVSKCRLFLISLTAGSTGLNLTAANHVFLLDSWWNPAVENQAIDRVHRIGQTKEVHVTKLKIADTIEERILAIQERKREIIDGALGVEGLKTIGRRRLTMQDLMGLFEDVAENVANRAENSEDGAVASLAQQVIDMARDMASGGLSGSQLRYIM